MKQYNRTAKRWEEEKPMSSLKRPETCKGKKPHNFVLSIPKYIQRSKILSEDEIKEYYRIEEERIATNTVLDDKLFKLGIRSRHYFGHNRRFFICSVCGKERWDDVKTLQTNPNESSK